MGPVIHERAWYFFKHRHGELVAFLAFKNGFTDLALYQADSANKIERARPMKHMLYIRVTTTPFALAASMQVRVQNAACTALQPHAGQVTAGLDVDSTLAETPEHLVSPKYFMS